jgi:hypothetical protein
MRVYQVRNIIIAGLRAGNPAVQGGEEARRWLSTYCLTVSRVAPPVLAAK